MKYPITATVAFAALLSAPTPATASQALLIGGGNELSGSQAQIELNVKWVQSVLEGAGLAVDTFFTDGDDDAPDVFLQLPDTLTHADPQGPVTPDNGLDDLLLPVARVFGDHVMSQRRYRNHQVDNVLGSTHADELKPALATRFADAADQPALLVYNGHGQQSSDTPDQVSLHLWGNTQMSAGELHELLSVRAAPTRFIFTQCYSGGFHRLAYSNPSDGLALSEPLRCGFTAESAYRLAEGCSAGIETDDYRDYTTFFFAALSGHERDGEIIGLDPDSNGDGVTTLREAHLFTLDQAFSTDLSRSTSEDYLLSWEPWYLKWLSASGYLPNNEYSKLYRILARRYSISLEGNSARQIQAQLRQYEAEIDSKISNAAEIDLQAWEMRDELQREASARWPALQGPYTASYLQLAASSEIASASKWIRSQQNYQSLLSAQQRLAELDLEILHIERNITQMQKLLHLRKLAHLKQRLLEYGSREQIEAYRSLVACEDSPLAG